MFIALVLLCLFATSAGAVEVSSFRAGNWVGGAYASDDTRTFSHCAVSAEYQNNVMLIFGLDLQRELFLGLSHGGWSLAPNRAVDVGMMVDGRIVGQFTGKPIDSVLLFVDLSDAPGIERTLRDGASLRIAAAAESLYFDLSGSSKALDALHRCVDDNLATAQRGHPQ